MPGSSAVAKGDRQDTEMGFRDPWRRHMRRTAERLRLLDAQRFEAQIEKIQSCLDRDARWDLDAALESCDRWRGVG
jgi:hypothetical protein